ncbi:hypothetical protein FB470_006682 [Amycolatopsis thermophila]|uniref:Uncharacterized protein n=1 Tax=Amycolatopsis thermophila TaxID=206084 RepID=A0ABU0F5N2_9PSEU|nr:hypothetical protein [Amycolatopsis thermophila]
MTSPCSTAFTSSRACLRTRIARISQLVCRRRNECGRAMVCSTTQRWRPRQEPCSVPRRAKRDAMPWRARGPGACRSRRQVGVGRVRTAAGPSTPASRRERASSSGASWVMSLRFRWSVSPLAGSGRFGDYMMFGAGAGAVDRVRTGFRPPYRPTGEPWTAARDQPISRPRSSPAAAAVRHPGAVSRLLQQEHPRPPRTPVIQPLTHLLKHCKVIERCGYSLTCNPVYGYVDHLPSSSMRHRLPRQCAPPREKCCGSGASPSAHRWATRKSSDADQSLDDLQSQRKAALCRRRRTTSRSFARSRSTRGRSTRRTGRLPSSVLLRHQDE